MAPSPQTASDIELTIDELAAAAGTTTRRVRSLQTLGLLPHPDLRGRTGLYGRAHQDRLEVIIRLQEQGFSLESLGVLFAALESGHSLADVLGVDQPTVSGQSAALSEPDAAELYGFAELQQSSPRALRRVLSVVPTTMWEESEAS